MKNRPLSSDAAPCMGHYQNRFGDEGERLSLVSLDQLKKRVLDQIREGRHALVPSSPLASTMPTTRFDFRRASKPVVIDPFHLSD